MEQAHHAATPCNVDKKIENNAGSDGSKWEKQCERGQRQTKHDWDAGGDTDDKNRVDMTNDERDDTNDSQVLTGGDITKYKTLVARISYPSHDRPDLKFAAMQVCFAMANPSACDLERVKRIGRYLAEKPRAECLFSWQQSGELVAYSNANWASDKVTRRCQLE